MKSPASLATIGFVAMALCAPADVITRQNDPAKEVGAEWSVKSSAADATQSADLKAAENFTPEPATLGLIGAGLATIGLIRRRSDKKK